MNLLFVFQTLDNGYTVLREYNNFRRYTHVHMKNTYIYKNFNRNYSGRSRFPLYGGDAAVYI